ncbi:MAG TPA: hypothetical protein VHE13_14995 [Opitutus sp.]|nr:hypothetical protein [Opitutus sp.]
MKNHPSLLTITVAGLLAASFAVAANPPRTSAAAAEASAIEQTPLALMRADINNRKTRVIAQNLPLTSDEAAKFWPLQREFEIDLNRLNDRKIALLDRYAASYGAIGDRDARELVRQRLDLEEQVVALKRAWFEKFTRVLPATTVMRFFQIENRLELALDLQVHDAVPLING